MLRVVTSRTATLRPEQDGLRLDRALVELFPEHSRSFLAGLIEDGHVRLDTEPARKASHRVSAGQVVDIDVPDPAPATAEPQPIPLVILHEDDHIVVIDKPPGIVVHPAAGNRDGTLVNALLFHVRDLSGIGGELRPGIVHRLDKDTSGVLLVAKSDVAHRALTAMWNTEAVKKEYVAIVYGTPDPDRGTIDAPLGRDPRDRKRMAVVRDGRRAVTEFAVTDRLRYASVVRCRLRTGRTHQIRVHLKHIGHPIIGDRVYSGPQWHGIPDNRIKKAVSSFPRQALHAASLSFVHPVTGVAMTFSSPLPEDMAGLITALKTGTTG
ncbi:MAG: RluA family pseudouridine synthase [Thermoanaerobaculia bacterium]